MGRFEGTQNVPSVDLGKNLGQEVPLLFRNRTLTHGSRHFDPDLFFQGSRIPPSVQEGKVRSAARFEKPPAPNSFEECFDVFRVDFKARTVLEIGGPLTGRGRAGLEKTKDEILDKLDSEERIGGRILT